jgi:hypothetical protein
MEFVPQLLEHDGTDREFCSQFYSMIQRAVCRGAEGIHRHAIKASAFPLKMSILICPLCLCIDFSSKSEQTLLFPNPLFQSI